MSDDRTSPETGPVNLPEQITGEIACILENCSGPEHQSEEALACLMQGYQSTWEQLREVILREHAQQPITHRWRSFGAHTWIYDPEPEWLEDHKFEVEWEPVYGAPQRPGHAPRPDQSALRAAAERVCWFDWSDNDMDACAAIDALRKAIVSDTSTQFAR